MCRHALEFLNGVYTYITFRGSIRIVGYSELMTKQQVKNHLFSQVTNSNNNNRYHRDCTISPAV
jgi:hypothetical protein